MKSSIVGLLLLLNSLNAWTQDRWETLEEHFKVRFAHASYGIHALMANDIPESPFLSMTDDMDDPFDGYVCDGASAYVYKEIAEMNAEDPSLKAEIELWKGIDHYALFSHMYPKVRIGQETRVLDFVPPYLSMPRGSYTHRDLEPLGKDVVEKKLIPAQLAPFFNQMLPFRYLETEEGGYLTLLGIEEGPQFLPEILESLSQNEDIQYSIAVETYFVKKDAARPHYDPKTTTLPPHPFERRTFLIEFNQALAFDFAYRDGKFLQGHGRWNRIGEDEFRAFFQAAKAAKVLKQLGFQSHPKLKHAFGTKAENEATHAVGQWTDFVVKWVTLERE